MNYRLRIVGLGLETLCLFVLAWAPMAGGAIRGNRVVFDSKQDWEEWTFPKGTVEITDEGQVQPAYIEKNINACLDAEDFAVGWDTKGNPTNWGGISGAGSNLAEASYILDGDLGTAWGPDPKDPLEDWWVEIDLGRLVVAERLVLNFPQGGQPFREFKVYVSTGEDALYSGSKKHKYVLVASTTRPNDRYTLEYPLEHGSVRYVFIILTARSDAPRLAELEVYTFGRNISLGSLERGGSVIIGEFLVTLGGREIVDGDYTTSWNAYTQLFDWESLGWAHIDLGTLFWVDAIWVIMPRVYLGANNHPLLGYDLFLSDGSVRAGSSGGGSRALGNLMWEKVVSRDNVQDREYILHESFAPRRVRHLLFAHVNNVRDEGTGAKHLIMEFMAFGQGYLPGITLTSPLIDLGRSRNIASLEWTAGVMKGAGFEVTTKTGDILVEQWHYYDKSGKEVSKEEWDKLSVYRKDPDPKMEIVPGDDWSEWSRPYLASGERFLSPNPRRYLQIQVHAFSEDSESAVFLDRLELPFTSPVAKTLIGEVWPDSALAGVPQEFSCFIRPSFDTSTQGFDKVMITTPSRPNLLRVKIGNRAYSPEQLDSVYTERNSLWMVLPTRVRYQQPPLIEVQFQCTVFLNGTSFETSVGASSLEGVWQRVDPGDATPDSRSDGLVVYLPIEEGIIRALSFEPVVITANGDGVNDRTVISFDVLKLERSRRIGVTVYDLQGKQVKVLMDAPGSSGHYEVMWDGLDKAGNVVQPGLYIGQVSVDAKERSYVIHRPIVVAF